MSKKQLGSRRLPILVFALCVTICSVGIFGVAYDIPSLNPQSFIAAALSAFSHNPRLVVTRTISNTAAPITEGSSSSFGTFNVEAKNVSTPVTLRNLSIDVEMNGAGAPSLNVSNVYILYQYCSRKDSSQCDSYKLEVATMNRHEDTYRIEFVGPVNIAPGQVGTLTIYANTLYAQPGKTLAFVRTYVTGGIAIGERCSRDKECTSMDAVVSKAYGPTIKVSRL